MFVYYTQFKTKYFIFFCCVQEVFVSVCIHKQNLAFVAFWPKERTANWFYIFPSSIQRVLLTFLKWYDVFYISHNPLVNLADKRTRTEVCIPPLHIDRVSFCQSWAHDNFIASRQRQDDNVIKSQGAENIQQKFRSRCSHTK